MSLLNALPRASQSLPDSPSSGESFNVTDLIFWKFFVNFRESIALMVLVVREGTSAPEARCAQKFRSVSLRKRNSRWAPRPQTGPAPATSTI